MRSGDIDSHINFDIMYNYILYTIFLIIIAFAQNYAHMPLFKINANIKC